LVERERDPNFGAGIFIVAQLDRSSGSVCDAERD
jgi:hypothetical protein